ncbi:MAG TPA: tetratricopeptide repeat protein [Mariniphaga sp.]|nr:tetratricopeptide repeat protein [Mariniphaga sp.]
MEFLKVILITILIAGNFIAEGQSTNEIVEQAFARSYENEKKQDFVAAINNLQEVYNVSSYEINLRLGWLMYNSGQLNESVEYYMTAQQLMPYSEEARFGLILPLAAIGKWDEVIAVYKDILEIHPNNTIAMFRLGMIYYERKQYDIAMPLFKRVVDLYPFDYDGLLMLAWTYYFTGNFNQATVLFNKVKLNNPGDVSASEGLKLMMR